MLVDIIPATCWCKEVVYVEFYRGLWQNIHCILGKCVNCGTIRTIESSSDLLFNYDDAEIYKLEKRHISSLKTINKHIISGSLLDIGASSGALIQEISRNNSNVTVSGIDLNKNAIDNPVDKSLNLKNIDLKDVDSTFNNVISLHVLEHIPDFNDFFKQINRITDKSAILYFAVPNINSYNATHSMHNWGALNPTQHSWHFNKNSFAKLINHFLPTAEIQNLKTSWIWPFSWKRYYRNILFEGDQLEIVIRL